MPDNAKRSGNIPIGLDANVENVLTGVVSAGVLPVDGLMGTDPEGGVGREPDVCAAPASEEINALIDSPPIEEHRKSRPRAFVIMPFGIKKNADNTDINFDEIYRHLIDPALNEAGFDAIRADEEMMSGDILTDMFQELLLADLVVADLSIDNANVFYELGVRHAFRRRGVVHIQCGRNYLPFDVFNVRTIAYRIGADSMEISNSPHLEADRENIIDACRNTAASSIDAVHSPIFNLLTGLKEPERGALTTPLATGFWREYTDWNEKIIIAHRQKRIGDIMLLTEEIDNPLIKEEAIAAAGEVLRTLNRPELALNEYRKGLKINPRNLQFRQEEALLLNDIGRVDAAIVKLERLSKEEPLDGRNTRYLGKIYVKLWRDQWIEGYDLGERRRRAYEAYQWIIKSIDTYLLGFRNNLNNYEMGIKALMLCAILKELHSDFAGDDDPVDADVVRVLDNYEDLAGALRFNLSDFSQGRGGEYWPQATLAELFFIVGENHVIVQRAYKKALSCARSNTGYLRASLRQLDLCVDIGFNSELAGTTCKLLRDEIDRIKQPERRKKNWELPDPENPVQSFVFAGHGLDGENTETPRFPLAKEDDVREKIEESLDRWNADYNDHAFLSGASPGSEILFIEACLEQEMSVHIHLPTNERDYLNRNFGDASWRDRYYDIRSNEKVVIYYQRERVGEATRPKGIKKYAPGKHRRSNEDQGGHEEAAYNRNIRWTLYCSMQLGIERLRLIAVWDGKTEISNNDPDNGRVGKMVALTRQFGGRFDHLDITKSDDLFSNTGNDKSAENSKFEMPLGQRVDLLRNTKLFEDFDLEDLSKIALVLKELRFCAGDIIAEQDKPGDRLFLIVKGEVSIVVNNKEVARRGAGECVGEMAFDPKENRIATLRSVGRVSTLTLGYTEFEHILDQRPEAKAAMLQILTDRLKQAVAKVAHKNGDGRS